MEPPSTAAAAAKQHKQAEKKLRKRKELDAMVANLSRKRLPSEGGGVCGGAVNVSQQQHELLRGSPNTDETSDEGFGVPVYHEQLLHHKSHHHVVQSHGVSSVVCRTCRGLWVAFSVGASFIIVITVLGLHVQMKMQLDTFRNELEQGRYTIHAQTLLQNIMFVFCLYCMFCLFRKIRVN